MSSRTARLGQLATFVALNASNGIALGMLNLALPLYALSLDANQVELGAVRGASGLGLLCTVIPAGFIIDHFGAKRMFHLGNAVAILCVLSLALVKTPLALALLMLTEGTFRSMKFTALNASFFQSLPQMGMSRVGWYKGSLSLGLTVLGPILGGQLLGRVSFETLFHLVMAVMLVPAALTLLAPPDPPRHRRDLELATTLRSQLGDFGLQLRQLEVIGALTTEALVAASFATFATFGVVLAVSVLSLTAAEASLLLGAEGLAFIAVVFGGGNLAMRQPRHVTSLWGIALAAAGLAGLSLAAGPAVLTGSALALGLGLGLLQLASSTCAANLPGEKGKVAALFLAAMSGGVSLGPIFGGVVAEHFGIRAVFAAFVPLFAAMAALLLARRPLPFPQEIQERS